MTSEDIYSDTLVPALEADDQMLIRRLARDNDLAADEIKRLAQAARDLEMWREPSLATCWEEWSRELPTENGDRYRFLVGQLDQHLERLRTKEKVYPIDPLHGLTRAKPILLERPAPTKVFTLCPYFSEETNCCGMHTIEAASGCALGCSFCPVTAFLGETAEFSSDLEQRLALLKLDPQRFYHVSTGQSSDSLVWGNRHGILDSLFSFARRFPNVQLELKTKTDRIDYLLRHKIPNNIVCTWLLNGDTIIRNEEQGTASLQGRLRAARTLADRGCRVGFHLNPLIYYSGWREEYPNVVGQLMSMFSPHEIEFFSLGVLSLTQPLVREIRHRGGESKVLQMPLVEDPKGRLTYPRDLRIELHSTVYRAMQPWHGKLFIYLCMETSEVWEAVLGRVTPILPEFERRFRRLH